MIEFTYKLKFLRGTLKFVSQELKEKYPDIEIIEENEFETVFRSEEESVEKFRNLYSPTHIEDSHGRVINLSRREWRKGFVPAGINPSLAYILCMVAKLKKEDILLDPFCGSSVIPITALKYFNIKRVICSDISSKAISASKENFKVVGIEESRYKLFRSDIKNIKISKRNIDKIVSNLPYGIRVGDHSGNVEVYKSLELLAKKLLRKKGLLVLLTQEKKLIREVFRREEWNVKSLARVNEGGLFPEIFVIRKK